VAGAHHVSLVWGNSLTSSTNRWRLFLSPRPSKRKMLVSELPRHGAKLIDVETMLRAKKRT
jgi:hypothetical protein